MESRFTRSMLTISGVGLEKYVLTDRISHKAIEELTRGDIKDFKTRLKRRLGTKVNTANKVLGVLKTILKEAYLREDLQRDPTTGVGILKEKRKEAGIFTAEELRALFPVEGSGPGRTCKRRTSSSSPHQGAPPRRDPRAAVAPRRLRA